MEFDEKSA
jgi:protein disulfide-isomerase A1